ncbi:MAG: 4-alpha-glucanotransferase [Bacteriovoracaceae bacterium]|nr:4-alpha-glucanotransferase [Bacteriovoracaceae bacterium]
MIDKKAGILLHISSLPSKWGIGDLGPDSYKFIHWLKEAGQHYWQVLPISVAGHDGSPYSSYSAFGGNPLLISPENLIEDELLTPQDTNQSLIPIELSSKNSVNFHKVYDFKMSLFKKAFKKFKHNSKLQKEFTQFITSCNNHWPFDLALFQALSKHFGRPWTMWPTPFKDRDPKTLENFEKEHHEEISFAQFLQFVFFRQWNSLKTYAASHGIKLIGDIPIFLSHHSMDVWKNPGWFKLDETGQLKVETGAAPDFFSSTGQKWGTPNYNWSLMKKDNYSWWKDRLRFMMQNFDLIRLDHFRGFAATWEVDTKADDAASGWWCKGPGIDFFKQLQKDLGNLPLIVEDLGHITEDVQKLRNHFSFPGMKVLQMAFASGDSNPYLPHNYEENFVVYTATHDNDTSNGYFQNLPDTLERHFVFDYLKIKNLDQINWDLIEAAMHSKACMAIIPLQDVMGLGTEGRFNTPGTTEGNWSWRFQWTDLLPKDHNRLKSITIASKRSL